MRSVSYQRKVCCYSQNFLFWMWHGSPTEHTSIWMVTLANKMFGCEPQRIQCLPLPTHCIHRELQRVIVWCALSSGGASGDEFLPSQTGYGFTLNSAWFQSDATRLHTSNAISRSLHNVFEDRVLSDQYPCAIWGKIFMATVTGFKLFRLFSVGVPVLRGQGISEKILAQFRNWKRPSR
jgi:hypothetical protein